MLYDVFAMCRERGYRPLLKGTDKHEQGMPCVDGERIGTTELNLKNSYVAFNTGAGCGAKTFITFILTVSRLAGTSEPCTTNLS